MAQERFQNLPEVYLKPLLGGGFDFRSGSRNGSGVVPRATPETTPGRRIWSREMLQEWLKNVFRIIPGAIPESIPGCKIWSQE